MKISFSSLTDFLKCGHYYKLRHIDRIQEINKSSALLFGSAVGLAVEHVLKDPERSLERCLEVFRAKWCTQEINGSNELLATSDKVTFFNGDFDLDVLSSEDVLSIFAFLKDVGGFEFDEQNLGLIHEQMVQRKREKTFNADCRLIFNYISWFSLLRKGEMILTEFHSSVLPRIKKVLGTETKVSIFNEVGDELKGFIDLDCIWEDGRRIKFDFKTSGKPYKADSVKTSEQLTTYDLQDKADALGYIVFEKNIRKKNPRVRIQVIIDNISESFENTVIDRYDNAVQDIKAEKFDKNKDSCYKDGFKCAYYGLCHYENFDGLIKIEKKKD